MHLVDALVEEVHALFGETEDTGTRGPRRPQALRARVRVEQHPSAWSVAELADQAMEAVDSRESHEAPTVNRDAEARRAWRRRCRDIPEEIRDLVGTIDVPGYRVECVGAIERTLFGWHERRRADGRIPGRDVALSPVEVRAVYKHALEGARRDRTMRLVRHAVDRQKNLAFIRKIATEDNRAGGLPDVPEPKNGKLFVFDPRDRREPTNGVRSFLEASPVQVPAYVISVLRRLAGKKPDRVLDVTAGSGTIANVVSAYEGSTIELDLAPTSERSIVTDIRRLKDRVGQRTFDLVFLHPPSIGAPFPVDLMNGFDFRADLARCSLEAWLETVKSAVRDALGFLAPRHGLLSLLVPEGVRDQQHVHPLPGVADKIVHDLPTDAFIVERLDIEWGARASQMSLGRARVPSVHLLIASEGAWS